MTWDEAMTVLAACRPAFWYELVNMSEAVKDSDSVFNAIVEDGGTLKRSTLKAMPPSRVVS
ncbi:MAG: hypothetical protein ACLR2G_11330 [Phascolarctobacterium faecium]